MSDDDETKDSAGNRLAASGLMPEPEPEPESCQPDISNMTEAQIDAELAKGFEDLKAGRTIPAGQAFEEIRKEFGIWLFRKPAGTAADRCKSCCDPCGLCGRRDAECA